LLGNGCAASLAAVAGAIFGYQSYKRKEAVHDLKASIPGIDDLHTKLSVGRASLTLEPRRHACNYALIVRILYVSRFAFIAVPVIQAQGSCS
jgi:hypothetical protein